MATINKAKLAEKLLEFDMFDTKKQATEFIEDFTGYIKDAVIAGDEISIPGFGKFEAFERQNGDKSPKFRPFSAFKDAVKG